MSRAVQARISSSALLHNLSRVRELAPNARIMAVIKADAYGHGLGHVLAALDGADAFAVACIEEALQIRAAGSSKTIVLLEGVFDADELPRINGEHIELVVHQRSQIEMLQAYRPDADFVVWLKVDTGMHRLGVAPDEVDDSIRALEDCECVAEVRLLTHLASADQAGNPATGQQLQVFNSLNRTGRLCSIANSAAILSLPETHADWVRPGVMLYGASPFPGKTASDDGLRPVMTLSSQLMAIHELKKGDRIGYGGIYTCPEDMPVGVVAIGYGDGYPRHAPNGTPVLVNGQRAPLVGRVSMDMITVDLRGIDCSVGDEAILWGEGLPAEEIAAVSETISYELFCRLTSRVKFISEE